MPAVPGDREARGGVEVALLLVEHLVEDLVDARERRAHGHRRAVVLGDVTAGVCFPRAQLEARRGVPRAWLASPAHSPRSTRTRRSGSWLFDDEARATANAPFAQRVSVRGLAAVPRTTRARSAAARPAGCRAARARASLATCDGATA